MKLTQQQIDELRAWQHDHASGGNLIIAFNPRGILYAFAMKDLTLWAWKEICD